MSAKKRKYNEDYIRFGFVSLRKGDTEVPQCVICYKTLSNDGMRPSRLERHLQTAHPGLVDKPKAFFETKKHTLKQVKMDDSGVFRQQSSKVVEAYYEISMLIAKSKKSHNIGETLIKPSILCAAQLILVNLKLQGKNIHIISHHDTIRTFMAKLDLWKCRIQQGNAASFRNLDSGLAHGNLDPELKILIITLSSLKAEFTKYLPDIDDMRES
ncbi:zinc finger BED domain-containing protein 5-like [Palaemon carinicauda]|uniref:zinc finger BED domain-containing protein 5-like n=1 Tax=Palaemon carinicauda TaxID=392227 RepID=UPI0035B5DBC7